MLQSSGMDKKIRGMGIRLRVLYWNAGSVKSVATRSHVPSPFVNALHLQPSIVWRVINLWLSCSGSFLTQVRVDRRRKDRRSGVPVKEYSSRMRFSK